MFKKVLASTVVLVSLANVSLVSADTYEEISCSTDSVFSENGCNQCFDGGSKGVNSTIGGLTDLWVNDTGIDMIMYEDLQKFPEMKNLNKDNVEWIEDKVVDNFWFYTDDVKALFNTDTQGYVLKPGQSVSWISSTEGSSYVLNKNTAPAGSNIGLLVYTITTNSILENGEPDLKENVHKECVLFKSGEAQEAPKKEKSKELPKTGPEHFFLLLLLAMFIAFGVLRFKKG